MMLNEKQKKLVEDNLGLAYKFSRVTRDRTNVFSREDMDQIAFVGLCKAAMVYCPERGTRFSTLAYACMKNEYRQEIRAMMRHPFPVPCGLMNDESTVASKDSVTFSDLSDITMDIERYLSGKPPVYRSVIGLYCSGRKAGEIADRLGITKSYATYIRRDVARALKAGA